METKSDERTGTAEWTKTCFDRDRSYRGAISPGIFGFRSSAAKYVVGYATYTARIVPLWLAQEQGFFAKYGIEVDPVFIRGAPTLVAGLAAGQHSYRSHRRQRHARRGCRWT